MMPTSTSTISPRRRAGADRGIRLRTEGRFGAPHGDERGDAGECEGLGVEPVDADAEVAEVVLPEPLIVDGQASKPIGVVHGDLPPPRRSDAMSKWTRSDCRAHHADGMIRPGRWHPRLVRRRAGGREPGAASSHLRDATPDAAA